MIIIEDIIRDYMATHSRLTVVGLGTFLRREGADQLLFTEFVMEDDGVLFETLVKLGVCELEATAMIENFVDAVQTKIASGERYYIDGVGAIRRTPVGVRFKYLAAPPVEGVVEEEEMESVADSHTEDGRTADGHAAESTAASMAESTAASDEPKIFGASNYKEFVPAEAKKGRRIDVLMLLAIVITIFAVCLFAYSLVIKWQMGELILPDALDRILVKFVGEL